ncbi:MAG: phosphoenolpyruvate hydrolase family protein [Gemmatimonadetes bacterium]|nr:phosphoenolpyruvate hydrolase family protein [Gemmatimonadota bacterium]
MPFMSYQESLRKLREQRAAGKPIIGAGAGTGISAKFSDRGGVDIIIIYNSGRYRMAGRGSSAGLMPYGDANAIVVEMAGEVLPVVSNAAVLAGVCGTDPFRTMKVFLKQLKEMGFDGVQNFPTVGVIDGNFRQILEETGMSYDLEVEMIRTAHEMEMLTCPYVFDEEQAVKMTRAGADLIVTHMNTTVAGSVGVNASTAPTLEEAAVRIQAMHDAAKGVNPDVMVICHGGPIAYPEDAQYIFDHTTGIDGFFGASSIERLAVEPALEKLSRTFKDLKPGGRVPGR